MTLIDATTTQRVADSLQAHVDAALEQKNVRELHLRLHVPLQSQLFVDRVALGSVDDGGITSEVLKIATAQWCRNVFNAKTDLVASHLQLVMRLDEKTSNVFVPSPFHSQRLAFAL